MAKVRKRGEQIRQFILENVEQAPHDIAAKTAEQFGISRQAVNKHLARLVEEKALVMEGQTRNRTYNLRSVAAWDKFYRIGESITEDLAWRELKPALAHLPENVVNIWHYGFTEMFNNAIDHSGGSQIHVRLEKTAISCVLRVLDDGVGIFKKIQAALALLDERHAVLALAKGKFTTDRAHHTGEGIFFTSRMMDAFSIISGSTYFKHSYAEEEGWLFEGAAPAQGTMVAMRLSNRAARTDTEVYAQYTSGGEDRGFTRTVVPVRLAEYGDDKLVSRSQAKRVLAGLEDFKVVVFDFTDVASIGPAFADELFRVFANEHPKIELVPAHANTDVQDMVNRALHARAASA